MIWRNGEWLDQPPGIVPGQEVEGVFSTVGCAHGEPLLWDEHEARLSHSMATLGCPVGRELPGRDVACILLSKAGCSSSARLRLVVGFTESRLVFEAHAEPWLASGPDRRPQRLEPVIWTDTGADSAHKWIHRGPWDRARDRARSSGADDALLIDDHGRALETSVANLWVVRRGRVSTPPAPGWCLPGVMRAWLVARLDATIDNEPPQLSEVLEADEVWLSSALIGVCRVAEIAGRQWQSWPLYEQLASLGIPAPGWPRS
jgi:branched-subunit amino acid aminotransferase/4-amino-4-deoxychorismate lyase